MIKLTELGGGYERKSDGSHEKLDSIAAARLDLHGVVWIELGSGWHAGIVKRVREIRKQGASVVA